MSEIFAGQQGYEYSMKKCDEGVQVSFHFGGEGLTEDLVFSFVLYEDEIDKFIDVIQRNR